MCVCVLVLFEVSTVQCQDSVRHTYTHINTQNADHKWRCGFGGGIAAVAARLGMRDEEYVSNGSKSQRALSEKVLCFRPKGKVD